MNRNSAIRAARTAVTGAQNAGRLDSYHAAEEMGIEMERQWVATLDSRTRHDHAMADGQTVGVDEPFIVGGYKLMYPGDPSGEPSEIYNCRCTQIAKVKGVDMSDAKRRARTETGENEVIENMTYAEWAERKEEKGTRNGTASNGDKYAYYPDKLGGVQRGDAMTFDEADGKSANPGYRKGAGTAQNCQSCVVAHEARMRGYDVEAQSYTGNKAAQTLAEMPRLAWVDPKTKTDPEFVPWDYKKTYDQRSYLQFLESNVEKDGRYTLEFRWANAKCGHIICADRDDSGALRLYDPQIGKVYSNEWEIDGILGRMKYTSSYGKPDPPRLLRVDTLSFREDVVQNIVKEERTGWKRTAAVIDEDDDWIPF